VGKGAPSDARLRHGSPHFSPAGDRSLAAFSKRGSKYLRTLLIQAAKVLLMRPHN
jgi:transposase